MMDDILRKNLSDLTEKCKSYIERGAFPIQGKPEELTKQYCIEPLLKQLGWSDDLNDEFYYVREFAGGMDRKWEDLALVQRDRPFDRPLIFMEVKDLFKKKILTTKNINQLLNYMKEYNQKNQYGYRIDWGILTDFREMHFFNVSDNKPFESLTFDQYIESSDILEELLSIESFKRNGIDHYYSESSKEVLGDRFLLDLKKWRLILANGYYDGNHDLNMQQLKETSQQILDRLIFIRMLETFGILPYNWLRDIFLRWREGRVGLNMTFSEVIRESFISIESLYDTELFLPSLCDKLDIDDIYWAELMKIQGSADPKVYRKIGMSGQQTLDDKGIYGYNFLTLTMDILGSAYERYLAHEIMIEKDRINIKNRNVLRKKEGIYYTPPYVVDYIVDTIVRPAVEKIYQETKELLEDRKIEEASKKIREISSLRVLDPSCGSGSFLIKVFDVIAEYYHKYNESVDEYFRKALQRSNLEGISGIKLKKIQAIGERILLDNIYGVDLDPQAVEITKLNLWLKMLSINPLIYKPVTGQKKKKLLPSLMTKIKCGNSIFSGTTDWTEIEDNTQTEKTRHIIELRNKIHERVLCMTPIYANEITEEQLINSKTEFEVYSKEEASLRQDLNTIRNESLHSNGYFEYANGNYKGLNGQPFNWEIEFPEVFCDKNNGFDIILGNPPHGADLSGEERKCIEDRYKLGKGYKNSAFLFLERCSNLLVNGGFMGLVIPKSLTFAQKWKKVRDFLMQNLSLYEIVDISKAFKGVLLEQVVVIARKNTPNQNDAFIGCFLDENLQTEANHIPIQLCKETDTFPLYADRYSISIHEKLKENSILLGEVSRVFRGLPFQKYLQNECTDYPTLKGADIKRYYHSDPIVFLDDSVLKREGEFIDKISDLKQPKIIFQRIVAHVTRPTDHIIIMGTLDQEGFLNVDTVENMILTNESYDPEYVLAILNSRLIRWYAYIFIFNKAVRTMDFDEYYAAKIPIPIPQENWESHEELLHLVKNIIALCSQKYWLIETFNNLLTSFDLLDKEGLNYYYNPSDKKRIETYGIDIAGSGRRISKDVKGVITEYRIRQEDDNLVVSAGFKESEELVDVINLKFSDSVLRDYFYTNMKLHEGTRNYTTEKQVYKTTLKDMTVRRDKRTKDSENASKINGLMEILGKEYEKIAEQFKDSSIQNANLAEIEQEIQNIDSLIDQMIYEFYGLSEDDIAFIEKRS